MSDNSYPKTPQNAVNRHKERGHYDAEVVHSIVNTTPVAHVSFVPDPSDPKPVVLPMIARIGQFDGDEQPACYVHGYVSARLFKTSAASERLEGLPVCIAATKIVNFVLALTPFNHSYDYRSAVIHGTATLLDPEKDREENIWAMKLITDGMVPHRWDNCRTPPDNAEIVSTRILKVRIDSASAKIRDTGVKNDKKDLNKPEVAETVWTGTIPYIEMLGTPVPDKTNKVKNIPPYILDHIKQHNENEGAKAPGDSILSRVVGSILGT